MTGKAMMKAILAAVLGAVLLSAGAGAQQRPTEPNWPQPERNNATFGKVMLNQNELRTGNGTTTYRWEGEGWYGDSLNQAWFRSEGRLDTNAGVVNEAEVQALYSRAVTTYFNLQAGLRYDLRPGPARPWLAFGVEGLAPFSWEIGAFGFVSDGGHAAARFEGYHDLYLTQRLIAQPQFEINFYSKSDPRRAIGAGLSDLDTGLRFRYELRRKFAPYIGITFEREFGQTADFARAEHASVQELRLAVGIRTWL